MRCLILILFIIGCAPNNDQNGYNGANGHSIVFNMTNCTDCSNGGTTILMALDTNDNGLLDVNIDSNVQSLTICNGNNGSDGQDGFNGTNGQNGANSPPTAFTPVELINPCEDNPSLRDEILIKLYNGTILASFSDNSNGNNTRFSLLTAGTYQTTDGDHCTFTINSNGAITYESHRY